MTTSSKVRPVPDAVYLRRGSVVDWLSRMGFSRYKIDELLRDHRVERRFFGKTPNGGGRAYYVAASIERLVVNDG